MAFPTFFPQGVPHDATGRRDLKGFGHLSIWIQVKQWETETFFVPTFGRFPPEVEGSFLP